MTEMTPIRFLAVEDDDVDMTGIERAFRKIGLVNSVDRAVDGIEAWDKIVDDSGHIRDECPHIILLDLNMPRMTGHEFLKKFNTLSPAPACDIFVLTTSDTDRDIIEAYKYGVTGYLLKSDLLGSLQEAIQGLEKKWMLVV